MELKDFMKIVQSKFPGYEEFRKLESHARRNIIFHSRVQDEEKRNNGIAMYVSLEGLLNNHMKMGANMMGARQPRVVLNVILGFIGLAGGIGLALSFKAGFTGTVPPPNCVGTV